MSKIITHSVNVEFGDCDPAAIVWFPNFFRWIDAASRHFFVQCGVLPWRDEAAMREAAVHSALRQRLITLLANVLNDWKAES